MMRPATAGQAASAETLQGAGDVAEKGLLVPSPVPSTAAAGRGTGASRPLQRWDESWLTKYRFLVCLYCFFVKGMGDSALGALIPYIQAYYGLSYLVVSVVFLATWPGYVVVALVNNSVHHTFGQRGIAFIGPVCRLVGFVPLALHPPFPAVAVLLVFPALGSAFEESTYNAWIGNMHRANELLGVFHGIYGLGAVCGPLVATAMVTRAALPWYGFYYVMVGLAALQFCLTTTAFWSATAAAHRAAHDDGDGKEMVRISIRQVIRHPVPWLLAFFILVYVGAELALGGWITTFMLVIRRAEEFDAGMAATGFWLGLTAGRLALGFVTGAIGEKLATIVYMSAAAVFVLLFWLVPSFLASAVFVACLGFCLGPVFPATIVVATKLLPPEYHVPAIGFSASFGGAGGSLAFVVGIIAEARGVQVLQPIALAMCLVCVLLWLLLPGGYEKEGLERARERNERPGRRVDKVISWVRGRAGVNTR